MKNVFLRLYECFMELARRWRVKIIYDRKFVVQIFTQMSHFN